MGYYIAEVCATVTHIELLKFKNILPEYVKTMVLPLHIQSNSTGMFCSVCQKNLPI